MIECCLSDDCLCFCGSGKTFHQCCQPIIEGKRKVKTAEALMRSRYSAYVMDKYDYVFRSWHPSTRPSINELQSSLSVKWIGLTVHKTQAGKEGDQSGYVEFSARYLKNGKQGEIHENSRFVFESGQWLYVDGVMKTAKVGRNEPCPCGSGKKFKKCCGAN